MPYPLFDRSKLKLRPLTQRQHDLSLESFYQLDDPVPPYDAPNFDTLARRIAAAHCNGRPVILMMGAHVIRAGVSRFLIDLMRRGILSHIAMNGAGPIHDYELALIGKTTESVAHYIRLGQFGLWEETGMLNEAAKQAYSEGIGFGEAIGRMIVRGCFPNIDASVLAQAYLLGVPVTVHVGIGYDIIHEHPNCDGAALGAASYTDFLVFTHAVSQLEGGVMLAFGSAVMAPEVYLKALSMARNVAHQEGTEIRHFVTAVFDLLPLEGDLQHEAPKTDPRYYYRPWKTILVRTVADGGESFYFCGDHRLTVPNLYHRILSHLETTP